MITPKQFSKKQGLYKKVTEDFNPYIVFGLMEDYSDHVSDEKLLEFITWYAEKYEMIFSEAFKSSLISEYKAFKDKLNNKY